MANSRKSSSNNLAERVAAQLVPLVPAHSSILVGLSGGVDSVVLLHLLHKLSARFSWQLAALHVHHGISQHADAWVDFCSDLCSRLHVSLHIERVNIAPLRVHGIEAAARKLRHAALAGQESDFIALAHHADDQAETMLLQLLRGAGVRGAAAMPQFIERGGAASLIRPLLHCSRGEILAYATSHQLDWIEDESNADDAYPRNFLRHRVLPVLNERFPSYRDTLVRSAQHFAEASALLDELARQDGELAIRDGTLAIAALGILSVPRAKNLLRYFLHASGAPMPQTVQLDDMLGQLCGARDDAAVCIVYGDREVRRYQGRVYVTRALGEFDRSMALDWHGEAKLVWPALHARLLFQHTQGKGISLARLRQAPVTLRLRHGGERLRPAPGAATRTLKKLMQEHHVPPWQRERLPLLYCGDDLACVPGIAVAADYQAVPGEAAIQPELHQ